MPATTPDGREGFEGYRQYLRILAHVNLDPRIRSKVDTSDIVQETLIKAHQAIDQFRGKNEVEVKAFLRSILTHTLVDTIRAFGSDKRDVARERSMQATVDESSARLENWLAESESAPGDRLAQRELLEKVYFVLSELPENQRTAWELRYLQGLSLEEISASMEVTKPSAAGSLRRGLKTLRERLGGQ